MAKGIDYAFSHPSTSALKGYAFACRYVSAYAPNDHNGKNILQSEKTALLAAGLSIVIVAEEGANRMLGGYSAGAADASHADAVVKALGMTGIPVYFACDWDCSPNDQIAVNQYLDGAASVIGRARVGIYGGYYPVKRALDAGKAAFAWQTYAWSGGQWDSRAQLRQTKNGVSVGGADCDLDESMADDYGQWPRPARYPTLVAGQTGAAVAEMQTRLNVHGAKLTIDASFGAATAAALRSFQSARKLTADAVCGPVTWAALETAPAPAGLVSYPAPTALAVGSISLSLSWAAVSVGGKPVSSYTAQAVGLDGNVYATAQTTTTSVTLSGLRRDWTYDIRVWANGSPGAALRAALRVQF